MNVVAKRYGTVTERVRRSLQTALVLIAVIALPIPAGAAGASGTAPHWTRPLKTTPRLTRTAVPVMQPLSNGTLLVRNGLGVIVVDARGATRWSMPNVDDAIVSGDAVVFRRAHVVFAVRAGDAGVLWKRPCESPPYFATAGERIVTMCGGMSTVLRARDGSVLAMHAAKLANGPPSFAAARPLNDDYVMVTDVFDGGWLGEAYYVVDAHTGTFLWRETDLDVVDVTPTTIAITPYPSMLPWAGAGYVEWRRLSDGTKVASQSYAPPKEADLDGRGHLVMSRAAVYVTTMNGTTFRFRRGEPREREQIHGVSISSTVALGSAAFVLIDASTTEHDGLVYLDRPSEHGGFTFREIGRHQGSVGATPHGSTMTYVESSSSVRLGNRIAIPENDVVRLYDEFGRIELTAKSPCTTPQLATTRTTLFMLCGHPGWPASLAAFTRVLRTSPGAIHRGAGGT